MSDGLLPPYGKPSGPPSQDEDVLRAFARGEQAGHSGNFHVEGPTLVASVDVAAALRIGAATILVRLDLPGELLELKEAVERALTAEAMTCLDDDTLLATAVAVQVLGLRTARFDLWGRDLDEAFADLRAAAAGETWGGAVPTGHEPPESPWG